MPFPAIRKRRYRRRHGRCYELSFLTLMDLHDMGQSNGVELVHGTVTLYGVLIAHAWLEGHSEVYDAVEDVTMPIAQYVAKHEAVAERRYTLMEACRIVGEPGTTFGPWHPTAGRMRDF